MSFGDLSRINTNVQALQANTFLQRTNSDIGLRQLRLATGSQLNRAEDDSAGYSISKKLEAKVRGQAQALANVGDAKSMLTVAEGALNSVMDILQTMKEKTVQAANDTMGTNERTAIQGQLTALITEIDDIVGTAEFNGTALLAGSSFTFQVGAGSTDTFDVTIASTSAAGLAVAAINVETDAASREAAILSVDDAIQTLSNRLGTIGDDQTRLTFKQENLQVSMTNYEAARSRISDADFAKEQMELVKLQILQQTGTAALAQANAAPQSILSLIGG
jgi:flagellin